MPEEPHHFSILSSESMEGPCSVLKKSGNGVHRVAYFELLGKGMVNQFCSRLLFVILKGNVKEKLKRRG